MFSIKGIGVKYFALFMAVVCIGLGVWLTFFHSQGFVRTQATVVTIEDITVDSSETLMHRATVEYTVDGVTYTEELGTESQSYRLGQSLTVLYDPNNPSVVHTGGFMGVYVLCVGMAIIAVVIVTEIRKRKSLAQIKAAQEKLQTLNEDELYPDVSGPERQLYFLTDLGTAKAGHRLEDERRNVLYEAKMTKFTLTAPFGFDFIDHEHSCTVPHLVGHEETTDWGNSLLLDNHYTFTFDGEDIWKHLKRCGICVSSSIGAGARIEYVITRHDRVIATAVSSSQNVHEEDEASHGALSSLVPVQGFYRVRTEQADLSLVFVTLLAFARSGATDDRGGNFRTILGTLNK